MKNEEKITEADVALRLAKKYPAPAWAFLTRVRRGTGYSTQIRTADALAMSLFPSRGFEVHGFEIKVSRNDWKKELADPEKSIELQNFCHRWWIAVPDKELVVLSEVPKNWGVIVTGKSGSKVLKDAPYLEADKPDYPLLASIFRNVHETFTPKDDVERIIDERKESWEKIYANDSKKLKELRAVVEHFESVSGLQLSTWGEDHKKLAKIVRLVLDMDTDLRWKFENLHKYAAGVVEALQGMEQEMKGLVQVQK